VDLFAKAAELTDQGRCFAIATVVRVEGSSSARRGSKAIIDSEGKLVMGWVGGGCAESAVRSEALRCLELQQSAIITLDMTDEVLGVGMPCGGKMDVYIEPIVPKPELLIAGHSRIAQTLAAFAHILGFRVIVNDPGAESADFPQADRVIAEDFDLNKSSIGPNTYVVIATQHKNDHRWLQKALDSKAAYVALVASQHRAKLVLDYLEAEGMPADKLGAIYAPAGLDLGAAIPEEIALSIISQIVALRRGCRNCALHRKQSEDESGKDHPGDRVISQCDVPNPG
jgi:xanthine dehydrogenase accessory factor